MTVSGVVSDIGDAERKTERRVHGSWQGGVGKALDEIYSGGAGGGRQRKRPARACAGGEECWLFYQMC